MRDINRIDPFTEKLAELWKHCPDLRFGQLIYIIADEIKRDIFFPEEKEWLEKIDKLIGDYKNKENNK